MMTIILWPSSVVKSNDNKRPGLSGLATCWTPSRWISGRGIDWTVYRKRVGSNSSGASSPVDYQPPALIATDSRPAEPLTQVFLSRMIAWAGSAGVFTDTP
jgi:hypothetical protein